MKKETKIEKVVHELSDLYNFYKKIPKVQESKSTYYGNRKSEKGKESE